MTLPASGEITLNDVNVELGNTGTDAITIGSADVRDLFGVASGEITMADGYGKSSVYSIDNSCRFNDNDSAHLSRTLSAGNRKTWTWSGWVKRGNILSEQVIFGGGTSGSNNGLIRFNGDDTLRFHNYAGGFQWNLITTALYRDTSSWYNIIAVADTSNGTSGDRVRLYVNGQRITAFGTETYPSQNTDGLINSSIGHTLARYPSAASYQDGYQAEVHFIDGTALTPSSFGETGDYGEWKPIEYTGSYGTNGFYLDFADSGDLGDDESGNGNDFTENNLSATDQMLDTPTNNFCTFNPIQPSETGSADFYEGNLKVNVGDNEEAFGTFGVSSGKWYFEMYYSGPSGSGNNKIAVGIADADTPNNNEQVNHGHSGTTYTTDDIIGVAVNVDDEEITFYKNNSAIETDTDWSGKGWTTVKPIVSSGNSAGEEVCVMNFGADSSFAGETSAGTATDSNGYGSFKYTPPTDFLALCTSNLPDVDIVPSEHFNTVLYPGSASSQSITDVGFQPDFVWIKGRAYSAVQHALFDAVRGVNKWMIANSTAAEQTTTALTSFNTDGFTVAVQADTNHTSYSPYVAWNWKANGSGSSNTNGSITSTVSANQDAGFSIAAFTGTGSNATVGHGLSSAPEMVIVKNRGASNDWHVYVEPLGATDVLIMNLDYAKSATANAFNSTAPTSTVFSVGSNGGTNQSSKTMVAYCFHSVDGYSKVGSYTGNGSTDGVYVHLGFRPMWIMIKRTSTTSDWAILDSARGFNSEWEQLSANESDAEGGFDDRIDFVSNGFKTRASSFPNGSSVEFIYLAFAEQPFKHTNAK